MKAKGDDNQLKNLSSMKKDCTKVIIPDNVMKRFQYHLVKQPRTKHQIAQKIHWNASFFALPR